MYKKIIIIVLCSFLLVGCTQSNQPVNEEKSVYKIVVTSFPQYDWVKELIKGKEDLYKIEILMDNGVDLHNYQPTVKDITLVATSDVFIYVGGESDHWVDDALAQVTNEKQVVMNMMTALGTELMEEAYVEGMQQDHSHEHGAEEHNEDDHEDGHEAKEEHEEHSTEGEHEAEEHHDEVSEGTVHMDEHVWLSLRNAKVLCKEITTILSSIDPDNQKIYENNFVEYETKLIALDEAYANMIKESRHNTVVFGDRFPFLYLLDDYKLDYYAAFSGCSAETEASFETIIFLANKIDELGVRSLCIIEGSENNIGESIINNTSSKEIDIVSFNSLQSVTKASINEGITYLSAMEHNLTALREVLTK